MIDRVHHVFEHRFREVELRFLLEIADGVALREPGLAVEVFVDARHDLHERALASAVAAEQADLGSGIKREVDVLEQLALAELLMEVGNLKDKGGAHRMECRSGGGNGSELSTWL